MAMSETRFGYDEALLSSCASSELASFVAGDGRQGWKEAAAVGSDESCSLLHQQHSLHYNRPTPRAFRKIGSDQAYELDERLDRFVRAVVLVHSHNANHQHLHRLALNRFADEDSPLFLDMMSSSHRIEEGGWDFSFLNWDSIANEWEFSFTVDLEYDLTMAPNLTVGKGGLESLQHLKGKKLPSQVTVKDSTAEKLNFPIRDSSTYFAVPPLLDPNLDGELLKVKPRRSLESQVESGEFEESDEFGKHLNWATENNPDGVPIVKDTFDQGQCGSCWAFAAAGSLEASVSRRQAQEAYNEYLEQASLHSQDSKHIDILHEEAAVFAKSVEEAAFQLANLSIQELIDCDTAADQGCIGGNPLLAFYFIHRYGLTSWSQYPYVGYEDTCQKNWVGLPIAKVKSWGVVSPNHEHHMELVIRFIGPIAVGVNGADRSFLAYQDGIFDHPYCSQVANHALLITGYGQEETRAGEVVKYWIARNSWGKGWGENGYIRVKRGDGMMGTRGVCGIARSPSVALGGLLLANMHKLEPYHTPKSSLYDSQPLSTSPPTGLCSRLGFQTCHLTFGENKGVVLGLTGIFCAAILVVWPLTSECRRRRRRRQRVYEVRGTLKLAGEFSSLESPVPLARKHQQQFETDLLLKNRNATVYGK